MTSLAHRFDIRNWETLQLYVDEETPDWKFDLWMSFGIDHLYSPWPAPR